METEIKTKRGPDISKITEIFVNYLVPFISLVLTILVGLLILIPTRKEIPQLKAELAEKLSLRDNLSTKKNNLKRLSDFKSAVEENSSLVNQVLVSEELAPGLLNQIAKIAQSYGLEITRLNTSAGATTESNTSSDYPLVVVNLGVLGSFEQIKALLDGIENSARVINVDSLRYSLTNKDEGNRHDLTLVLVAPYLFVESQAVTDEPIDLDLGGADFISLVNRIKKLTYYDPYEKTPIFVPTPEPEETPDDDQPEDSQPSSEDTEETEETTDEEL